MSDTDSKLTAYYFGLESTVTANEGVMGEYVELRAKFYHPRIAFVRIFGSEYEDEHLMTRIEALELNPALVRLLKMRRSEMKVSDLVTERTAVEDYLSISRNPFEKGSTRVAAMREVNVLMGIAVVDEKGQTKRAGMSLDDFYTSQPGKTVAPASTLVPEANGGARTTH